MSWSLRSGLRVAVAALAIFTGGSARAEAPGVEFTISLLQGSFLLHEPVYVRATLRNVSSGPVTVPFEIDHATQQTRYNVLGADGAWRQISPGYVKEPVGDSIDLAPGESFSYDQPLVWDATLGGPVFPEAGTWTLLALLYGVGSEPFLESNPLRIEVTPASGVDETPSLAFGEDGVIEVAMGVGESAEAIDTLDRLLGDFPDSRFASYAAFYLGERMLEGYQDRSPDPARAVGYLRRAVDGPAASPQIQAIALYRLGRAQASAGDPRAALATQRRLLREHPDSSAGKLAKVLIAPLEKLAREREAEAATGANSGGSPAAAGGGGAVDAPSSEPDGTPARSSRLLPAVIGGVAVTLGLGALLWRRRR